MEIHTRAIGNVHVLDISGKITLGEATAKTRHTISDLLANGGKKIVLNLTDVNYVDRGGRAKTPQPVQQNQGTPGDHQALDRVPGLRE
jgi:hypothetical protein